MTTVVKQCINNGFYVSLSLTNKYDKGVYIVQACPCIDEFRCGYPENEMTYPIEDKKKAYATYNRYVNKYCK